MDASAEGFNLAGRPPRPLPFRPLGPCRTSKFTVPDSQSRLRRLTWLRWLRLPVLVLVLLLPLTLLTSLLARRPLPGYPSPHHRAPLATTPRLAPHVSRCPSPLVHPPRARGAMGIDGLWKVVEPAMEQVDFTAFLINHVPPSPPNRRGYYRLGVDVSIWLRQCCAPFQRAHAQAGPNPELRTFYYRLVNLLARPVAVVFVADGPGRPTIKRGTHVVTKQHWLTAGAKDLVDAFGFDWIEAPGEAEAELASMNALRLIDGVMSDDSDALVFGARMVIRNPPKKQKHSQVKVNVLSDDKTPAMGDLLLIAVLAGSDYSKGLDGCGIKTAVGLARYGLGTSLLSQAWDAIYTGNGYQLPLDDWRDSLRHYLRHDSDGHVGQRNAALAASVTDDFPNVDVVMAHVRPLTTGGDCIPLGAEFGRSARFHVARIGQLCDKFFSWNTKTMAAKMSKSVWPAVVMRLLGAEKHELEWAEHQIREEDRNLILNSITLTKTRTRPAAGYIEHQLTVDISPIHDATFSLLNCSLDTPLEAHEPLKVWVPASVIAENRAGQLLAHRTAHRACKPRPRPRASHLPDPGSSSLVPLWFSPSMLQPSSSPYPPLPSSLLTEYLQPRSKPPHIIDLTGNHDEDEGVIDLTLD